MILTNKERASRASAAVGAYCDYTGDLPDESHFRDLLGDMMHLAQRDRLGFRNQLRLALSTFLAEGGRMASAEALRLELEGPAK